MAEWLALHQARAGRRQLAEADGADEPLIVDGDPPPLHDRVDRSVPPAMGPGIPPSEDI